KQIAGYADEQPKPQDEHKNCEGVCDEIPERESTVEKHCLVLISIARRRLTADFFGAAQAGGPSKLVISRLCSAIPAPAAFAADEPRPAQEARAAVHRRRLQAQRPKMAGLGARAFAGKGFD